MFLFSVKLFSATFIILRRTGRDVIINAVAYRGGGWGVQPPPPENSEDPPKSCQTQLDCENLKIAEFRKPTPQDVRKKCSKILKLPPVRNCFTLVMTNKLVVIINSLNVPKVKKILLYEMKFLVPNYSCLQNPWLGGYRPQIPVLSLLCPQLNLLTPTPRTKFLGTPLHKCIDFHVKYPSLLSEFNKTWIFEK